MTDADEQDLEEDDTLTESEEEGSTGFLVAEPMGLREQSLVRGESLESQGSVLQRLSTHHGGIRGLTIHTSVEKMFEQIGEDLTVVLRNTTPTISFNMIQEYLVSFIFFDWLRSRQTLGKCGSSCSERP